jgi:riboflavin synthase
MFTGIVTEVGEVRRARRRGELLELEVEAPATARRLRRGESVAVDGVCLTAVAAGRRCFGLQVMGETLERTTLGALAKGDRVNLELPVRAGDRLGGHVVQGHVDGVVRATRVEEGAGTVRLWLEASDDVLHYLVPKGSVALDGVSLTVVEVGRTTFQVALIPHTLEATTLNEVAVDRRFNVEVDVLAKYVERLTRTMERR